MVDAHEASVQDRDGAPALIVALLGVTAGVKKLFADSGYAGPKLQDALKDLGVPELIEIVPKPKGETRRVRLLGIYGIVASLGGGPEAPAKPSLSVFKDLRMDGVVAAVLQRMSNGLWQVLWPGCSWPDVGS